jgi:hypothetical protein
MVGKQLAKLGLRSSESSAPDSRKSRSASSMTFLRAGDRRAYSSPDAIALYFS